MLQTFPLSTNVMYPDDVRDLARITIDSEFRGLIPPISDDERRLLEENIVAAGGVRDPLTLWLRSDEDYVILDGHNRFEICKRLRLPFPYHEVEFDTREEAADWMDRNQLGRRNLSRQDYKLLLGRRYNRAKRSQGAPAGNGNRSANKEDKKPTLKTAEKLAREHGVDEKTVRRAGAFQAAASKLDLEQELASGQVKANEPALVAAAKSLPANPSPEQVQTARQAVARAKPAGRFAASKQTAAAADRRRVSHKAEHKLLVLLSQLRNKVEQLEENTGKDSNRRQRIADELRKLADRLTDDATGDEYRAVRLYDALSVAISEGKWLSDELRKRMQELSLKVRCLLFGDTDCGSRVAWSGDSESRTILRKTAEIAVGCSVSPERIRKSLVKASRAVLMQAGPKTS